MRYLITGITGFTGPHMAKRLLAGGHEVYGLYRSPTGNQNDISDILGEEAEKVTFIHGDFLDKASIDKVFIENKFDGVFHLGAASWIPLAFSHPRLTFKTNALGTINICDAILKFNPECRLMNCSSSEVYGIHSEETRISETIVPVPQNPYAVAKLTADWYLLERARNVGLSVFITRAFSHTGPRRGKMFSISSDAIQIARIIKGKQEPIIKVGNMSSKRVVMDVRDVVDVYYKLMQQLEKGKIKNGEIFNISGNDLYTMQFYLDKMLQLFNVKAETVIEQKFYRKIDIPVQHPDSTKVRKLLDWAPTIPIETTLKDLVNYWLEKIR